MAKGQSVSTTRGNSIKNILNYPRAGVSGWKRFLPSLRLMVTGGLSLIILGCIGFIIGYAVTDIPEPNIEATGQTSTVYYSDGKTPIGQYKVEDRKSVPIDEISKPMQLAAIAAEDTTFYENRGISIKGLSRAVVGVATNNYAGGGSTITQQYVKNFYLTNEHSMGRKVKEMFIALKIDQEQSKDEILANYLNTIYLGRRSYGIEVASENYFDKPAKDLNLSESALLAAMIQRPGAADPADNPEAYEDRFNYVIKSMVDEGFITQEQADEVEMPKVKEANKENSLSGQKGYMWEFVRREVMAKLNIDESQLDRGGYEIVTTFDKDRMKDAEKAIESLPKDKPKGLQAGLVSINPKSGAIEAFYGGEDYLDQAFNASTQAAAQAGSTFKPFALVAGLENGVRLTDRYVGSPTTLQLPEGGTWRPKNFGGASYGPVTLLKATQSSINTAYAQLNVQVGPEKTVDVAERAGFRPGCTKEQEKQGEIAACTRGLEANSGNVLGTASPRVIDMATAYATFASNGVRHETHAIDHVTDAEGTEIYKAKNKGKRVFDKAVAAETSYALRQVVNGGSGSYAQNLGRPAAGKTGTSSDNYSAWFAGYTPNLSTVVALYRQGEKGPVPIGSYGGRSEVTGGSFPIQVWTEYMQDALKGEPIEKFPERGQLPQVKKPVNPGEPAPPRPSRQPRDNDDNDRPKKTKAPIEEPKEKPTEDPKDKDKESEGEKDGSKDAREEKDGSKDGGDKSPAPEPKDPPKEDPPPTKPPKNDKDADGGDGLLEGEVPAQ